MSDMEPSIILIFSGKRKSGKDYTCQKLSSLLTSQFENMSVNQITLAAILKESFAYEHNLNYEKLLDSSEYKETYRLDLIKAYNQQYSQDKFIYCRKGVEKLVKSSKNTKDNLNIWIITDARRSTDIDYFRTNFPNKVKTIRVVANDLVRGQRNWKYTNGVDDSVTECDLDGINDWDFIVNNNNDEENSKSLKLILEYIVKNIF